MSEITIQKFIAAANQYDTQSILDLFAADAVINDVSVGERFEQRTGIKKYFETFFIGYHTKTRLLALENRGNDKLLAKVDFTGDFGHETGGLEILFTKAGLILHIDAYLD
jgi:ketosteroid isomerase-like protein